MNMHILRVRDTLYSSVPYVAASIGYDPTSIAIGAGSTLYGSVRGDITSTSNGTTSVDVDESEAERGAFACFHTILAFLHEAYFQLFFH